jgi:predicted TPR repeat methyltransferase
MINYVEKGYGVDLSESMLNECRKKLPKAELIQADITRDDVLGDIKFDLITAFRFFPNAQASLRSEAIKSLTRHLKSDGLLVFNNHRNKSSTLFSLAKIIKKNVPTMSNIDVEQLVASAGLKILKVFPVGALPGYDNHPVILPLSIHKIADEFTNLLGAGRIFCQNIIYICQKNNIQTN